MAHLAIAEPVGCKNQQQPWKWPVRQDNLFRMQKLLRSDLTIK
jgi:hypothetical protein